MAFTSIAVFAAEPQSKSNEYLAHCNFAFGPSYGFGGKITGSKGLGLTLVDHYGDRYNFDYSPDKDDNPWLGFNIMLSFPFYYQEYFSFGMHGQILLNGLSSDSLSLYYYGGLYAEGIYKKFSIRAGIGMAGINMDKTIGRLARAWPGDPGYYTGSKFIKPGEKLTASSYEFLGIMWIVTLKYYPFKEINFLRGIFMQLGYSYWPGLTVSDYVLKLSGIDVPPPGSVPKFTVAPVHQISLMLGIGL